MRKRRRNSMSLISNNKNEPSMEDRIGKLPDDVLGVIISHLTLEEAGRTSVFSRRWKNSWTMSTRLNFDAKEGSGLERKNYTRWVNRLLKTCRASDLDEFSVVRDLDPRSYRILDKWICFAVRKRVKTININLWPRLNINLWPRLNGYGFIESAPDLSGIECLTSLCLNYVNITGEMIECLLSVCPLLEKLSLERSKKLSNLKVVGSSLKLKCFQIVNCDDLKRIEIYAPNLVSFRYYGWPVGLQVQNLSCLVDLSSGCYCRGMDSVFGPFSGYLLQLETLALDYSIYERFFELVGQTQLTNLRHLTLEARPNSQQAFCALPQFIKLCPLLHKLTLKLWRGSKMKPGVMKGSNQCPHQCLKVVELIGFDGHCDHIELAMFILENANGLDKFIINLLPCEEQSGKDKSRQQVEQLKTEVPHGVKLLILEGCEGHVLHYHF